MVTEPCLPLICFNDFVHDAPILKTQRMTKHYGVAIFLNSDEKRQT